MTCNSILLCVSLCQYPSENENKKTVFFSWWKIKYFKQQCSKNVPFIWLIHSFSYKTRVYYSYLSINIRFLLLMLVWCIFFLINRARPENYLTSLLNLWLTERQNGPACLVESKPHVAPSWSIMNVYISLTWVCCSKRCAIFCVECRFILWGEKTTTLYQTEIQRL